MEKHRVSIGSTRLLYLALGARLGTRVNGYVFADNDEQCRKDGAQTSSVSVMIQIQHGLRITCAPPSRENSMYRKRAQVKIDR